MPRKRKLFCEHNRLFYQISVIKENLRRDIRNLLRHIDFAAQRQEAPLPCTVKGHRSLLLRQLLGVDLRYQHNKVQNLKIAASRIDGLMIMPGQTFSFWQAVGRPCRQKGYIEGLVLSGGKMAYDIGGGICQLANLLHQLVLHSPLTVTEIHHHTDCLFPDSQRRVPFGTGTSVFYKNVDYQFTNTTTQNVQLKIWLDDEYLCGELRSQSEFPFVYRLLEEDHHFAYDGPVLYRNSNVYRLIFEKATRRQIAKELILKNHSEVLYDYSLVDPQQIRRPKPMETAYVAG